MNVLRFTKGYNNWETTYEVELDFEYTENLEKKISSLIIYRQDLGKKAVIPWQVFENYATGQKEGSFADASGLRIGSINGKLSITQGYNFNVIMHEDQIEAIRRAAKNIVEDVSYSVENILKEYAPRL
jgi:hypothetical protein